MRRVPSWRIISGFWGLLVSFQGLPGHAAGLDAGPATPPAAPPPSYLSYVYEGDRYRDPFISLNGDHGTDNEHAPQIGSLILKGIVKDKTSRVALLTSGASSYILRGGRLYDSRNRPLKGMTGVIKAESVIIVGSDRTVREISAEHT